VVIAVQNRFGGRRFVQQGDQRRQLLGAAGVHPQSHGAGPEVHAEALELLALAIPSTS